LSAQLGGPRLWIKRDDLTDMPASGNKLRKLEYSIAQAQQEGATVLITCGGVQSNHCRATAVMASRLGLKSHLLLRGKPASGPADGNLLIDHLVGAEVQFLSMDEWRDIDHLFEAAQTRWRADGEVPFVIPTGASDEIGLWGYINAAAELKRDFESRSMTPEHVVSAAGSGGTLAGLIIGRQLEALSTDMIAFNVCDDEAWFRDKIGGDITRWQHRYEHELDPHDLAINVIDGYVGPGYGRADHQVFETIHTVARLEGVLLDPVYTGKALDGMLREIRRGRFDGARNIVFLHTGGLFGLFPQLEHL